jgi:plastocyanin
VILFALVLLQSHASAQSLSYTKGQNVAPAYEGWEQTADGTKYFLFGYMNRNWEEEIDVPVGRDNGFNVGGDRGAGAPAVADRGVGAPAVDLDQGQPTHFLPRRNRFIFRVRVPNGFTEKDELIWTLTTRGKTEKAYASLRADYIVDDVVKASETGALGAGTSSPEVRSNRAPTVRVEEVKARNVKIGEALTLVTEVKDDGIPKPRDPSRVAAAQARAAAQTSTGTAAAQASGGTSAAQASSGATSGGAATPPRNPAMSPPTRVTVGKNLGLHVSWFVYRGAGKVTFDPPQIKAWEDTRAGANSPWAPLWAAPKLPPDGKEEVHVTFDAPGTYVLRCRADDGALVADEEITITVVR